MDPSVETSLAMDLVDLVEVDQGECTAVRAVADTLEAEQVPVMLMVEVEVLSIQEQIRSKLSLHLLRMEAY
jgi:hypothetical protein